MKTNRFIIAALAIAAAVSCQKDGFTGSDLTRETESATIISGSQTKTSLSGKEIHWTSDDVIAVFDNSNYKNQFSIAASEGSYATFSGEVTEGTTQIYAVYPHSLAVSASGSTLKVNIPADQTSKAGSFAEEHNISVAKGTKTPGNEAIGDVTFKNVCALLKFTIPSYISDATSVTLSSNSVIAGELTVDYSGETPASTMSTKGSKSITMTGEYPAGSTFIFVLAPGTLDGFTITATSAKGTWTISRSTQVELTAGNYRNLGTLELEQANAVSASAAHVYSGSTLTGTNVSVSLNIPATTAKYITALNLQVKNSAGTVVRTLSKSSAAATETIAPDASWPYLPQGSYTVSGTYTLSGSTTKEIAAVTFTSPAPTFVVTSNAYSSYTKYNANQSSVANTLAADQIYDINKASVTISSDILNNANYSGIIGGYTYKLDNAATTAANATGQALGPHTVTATYTFDSVALSGSSDCHITGLPYTLNVSGNDSVSAWSEDGDIEWGNTDRGTAVRVGYGLGGINTGASYMTKTFNIPANINVSVTATGEVRGSRFITNISTTGSVKVSETTLHSASASGKNSYTSFSGTKTGTMTTSSPTVQLYNSKSTNEACTYFKSLFVGYGNK